MKTKRIERELSELEDELANTTDQEKRDELEALIFFRYEELISDES